MKNNDYNFNYSECLKEKDNLTYREIINVCNGETTKINYGVGDLIIIIVVLTLLLTIIGTMLTILIDAIRG